MLRGEDDIKKSCPCMMCLEPEYRGYMYVVHFIKENKHMKDKKDALLVKIYIYALTVHVL